MSNKFKEIDIKNRLYYIFEHIINIKDLDPNKIKINENSHKNVVIYQIEYVPVKCATLHTKMIIV